MATTYPRLVKIWDLDAYHFENLSLKQQIISFMNFKVDEQCSKRNYFPAKYFHV